MVNPVKIQKDSPVLFNGAGGSPAFSVQGLANGSGWVSAQYNLGVDPRPCRFTWHCECQWQATPNQGGTLQIYVAGAPDDDSTKIDGDIGSSDAALGDVDMRRNLRPIGAVVSENAAASEVCRNSGVFDHYDRYLSIVVYNDGGSSINATAANFRFVLTPMYDEIQ